jgi:hypothetical protein
MHQDKYHEGEHGSLLPTTHTPTKIKSRTVCCQEGENDEDIIGSKMTMPTTSTPKVQPFYMRLIIDAFDELMLHHDMCSFSFSELLTWIKGRFDCIWKARRLMKLIGDQIQVFLTSSARPPRHFGSKVERVQVQHVLEVEFGLQNSPKLRRSPRLHTDSDWDIIALFGKLIKSIFQWMWTHGYILSDASTIIVSTPGPFLPLVLRHPILGRWSMYQFGSIKDVS